MLRSLFRIFSTPNPPKPVQLSSQRVTIYAKRPSRTMRQVVTDSQNARSRPHASVVPKPTHVSVQTHCPLPTPMPVNHRQRVLSMKVAHLGICGTQRAKRLAELNIITAGDLAFSDPAKLAEHFGAPRKAASMLRHYRRAIRLAASVPGMTPRDAILLVSIHRRSTVGLARETASGLHRDLQRFAESSRGRSLLRGRRLPSTRRIKQWIVQCESGQLRRPSCVTVA